MRRNRKYPPIPSDLLIDCISGEKSPVISAFVKVITLWIDKGTLGVLSDSDIELYSGLDSRLWKRYGPRLKSVLQRFYGPYLEYYAKWDRTARLQATNIGKGRIALANKRRLSQKPLSVSDSATRSIENPHTFIRENMYSESPNFDAKSRAQILKRKLTSSDQMEFID